MERYRVKPGERVDLSHFDAADTAAFPDGKQAASEAMAALNKRLEDLQERLWAEHRHPVLVVLQGMDTSGKDGVIRHVFEGVNPTGVRVASFNVPTREELDHDFLWRIHARVPGRGEIVIFNRSHYEDVLAARVRGIAPPEVWKARFDHINAFEAPARRAPAPRSSSSSSTSTPTSRKSGCRRARTTRRSAGSSASATWRTGGSGRSTRRPTRRPSPAPAPTARPGTSCPPTRSGTATW